MIVERDTIATVNMIATKITTEHKPSKMSNKQEYMMGIRPLFFFMAEVTALLFLFGCSHRPMHRSGQGWDHMMGYGGYGGMFMWLIWILIAGVIIYFVVDRMKNSPKTGNSSTETALDILKKRYARGEITKEEFEKLKIDIEK